MRKLVYISLVIFSISLVSISCNNGKYGSSDTAMDSGDKTASLWTEITEANYSENWKFWPGKEKNYKGTQPHGAILNTYLNDTAYNALTGGDKELPYGSIVIKENYMPNMDPGAITVMERIKGYYPEAGDWYWVKFKGDGTVHTKEKDGMTMKLEGKVAGCIGCHTASISGVKYIMTPIN